MCARRHLARGKPRRHVRALAAPAARCCSSCPTARGWEKVRGSTETMRSGTGLHEYAATMAEAEQIARFGVWRWEVATGRVHWSEQLERIYGLAPGSFGGTVDDFISFVHPDDRQRVWSHVQRTLETLEPFIWEERIRRSDGKERVLLSQGRPILGP